MIKEETKLEKKKEIMEKCFDCYCENGLAGTGIKALAKACNMSPGNLYSYFSSLDQLIVESTAYCMAKVEDDFMLLAPKSVHDIPRFLDEIPYWTKEKHGKKYRLMYQVYTHPKYKEAGTEFFIGVDKRYHEYAKRLEKVVGIPSDILAPIIFIFIRASVHYALFEEEDYLKSQISVIRLALQLIIEKYHGSQEK